MASEGRNRRIRARKERRAENRRFRRLHRSLYSGKTPPWEFPTFIECYDIGVNVPDDSDTPDNTRQWEMDLAYQARIRQ